MAGWWEVRPTLMNFAQYDVSHDILLCRNPFLTVGCHSPFHPDLERNFNISATEAMSVVLVFKDCFQRSVWWPTVQREDPDMTAQWARMQENSSLVSDSTPAQSHQGHTAQWIYTSSSSRSAAEGSWPGASTSGGPIPAGGGDSG